MYHRRVFVVVLAALAVSACSGNVTGGSPASGQLSPIAQLGEKLFADPSLSVSGQQACVSCHLPTRAFAAESADPANPYGPAPAVAVGGPSMTLSGFRNAPSLMYASFTPAFYYDAEGGPNGGFFRDGRAATLADQAMQPLVTSFEMGGAGHDTAPDVAARLRNSPNYAEFRRVFGTVSEADPQTVLAQIGRAIAAYEQESREFHPFSSKFDQWRRGDVQLTAQEIRGFALFNSPTRGNCAACHLSASADGVTPALFTDFTYDNLGLPRNPAIPANSDTGPPPYTPVNGTDGVHRYYDLGICGPIRLDDGLDHAAVCGQFKVPTLRNIALTAPYFHNGVFDRLQDVLGFYVRRDVDPQQWFPVQGTLVTKFDDLPATYGGRFVVDIGAPGSDAAYAGNVNTAEVPYDRHIGELARLDPAEIEDVVAFLCTLTDGYDPSHPAAYPWPAQCQAAEPLPTSITSP